MAIRFCDGFDHYDFARITKKWDAVYSLYTSPTFASGKGRFGTTAFQASDNSHYLLKACPSGPQPILSAGVSVNPSAGIVTTTAYLLCFRTGATDLCGVGVTATHQIFAFDGTGIIGYGAAPLRTGVSQYIELSANKTAATIKVYMNEVLIIDASGVTIGVNMDAATLGGYQGAIRTDFAGPIYYDDFYLTDGIGSYNTGVLGDVRIEEIFPNADGFYKEWTPLTGSDHFEMVNENPPDDDTTYNSTTTVDNRDTMTYPSVTPTAGDVKAVCVNFWAKKEDSGARSIAMISRLGGVDGVGTTCSLGNIYGCYQSYMERDPNGDQWTIANINASEAGPKLVL